MNTESALYLKGMEKKHMGTFSLDGYFKRIGYVQKGQTPLEAFIDVHTRHMLTIPFENIDVYNGKMLSLEPDDLYTKIVENRRGGYCFEMNGLLAHVLRSMGYQVKRALAQLGGGQGPHAHCVNIVTIDGMRYVADVGFGGGGFIRPLCLETTDVQTHFGLSFRVRKDDALGFVVSFSGSDGEYSDYLCFHDIENPEHDFIIASFYTNCFPTSRFRTMLMCTIPTVDGRINIQEGSLKIRKNGIVTETKCSETELYDAFKKYLGLDVKIDFHS